LFSGRSGGVKRRLKIDGWRIDFKSSNLSENNLARNRSFGFWFSFWLDVINLFPEIPGFQDGFILCSLSLPGSCKEQILKN